MYIVKIENLNLYKEMDGLKFFEDTNKNLFLAIETTKKTNLTIGKDKFIEFIKNNYRQDIVKKILKNL